MMSILGILLFALAPAQPDTVPNRDAKQARADGATTTRTDRPQPKATAFSDGAYFPEETPVYLEWAQRACDNEKRYTDSYRRSRRALEAMILRSEIRDFLVEDYVLQLQVLGDEARIVELCCRMSSAGPRCREARKRLFKMAKGDLLAARQYKEVLRVAGDVQTGYDRLVEKYQGKPERNDNWCELRYRGDCATEFHDAFAYFEALVGTEQRAEAVVLAEKLIRTRIDPGDLLPGSRYTIWELPEDIGTAGAISQLIVSANRASDPVLRDALEALALSRQTEADLDAFREDVLGVDAMQAKQRILKSVFVTDPRRPRISTTNAIP